MEIFTIGHSNYNVEKLIDMLRYYEGDPKKNYKAKEKYKDLNGKGTTTFGYGITQLPKKIGKLAPPKNEKEAYNMLMLYLDKVSYDEAKKMFRAQWKDYPESLKEIVVPKLKHYMEKGASVFCKKLPIPCVPETGDHWIH